MAISFVQHSSNKTSTTATTLTATFGSNITAGNSVIAVLTYQVSTTVSSIKVGASGTGNYSMNVAVSSEAASPHLFTIIYYLNAVASGQNDVIVTIGSAGAIALDIYEFSGIAGTVDQIHSANATSGTSAASGTTGTLYQATELVIGVSAGYSTSSITGPSGSWTNETAQYVDSNDFGTISGYQIVSATTGLGYTATLGSSNYWAAAIATFAATAAIYTTAGTYTWVAPTGVSSANVECWGAGGGGGDGAAGGGGGGEFAQEPANTVVAGDSYTVVVGAGQAAGNDGVPAASSTFSGTSATTVTAHGGTGGDGNNDGNGGTGGTGSSNTTHHNGGSGGSGGYGPSCGGGGGGSSGGTAAAGNGGGNNSGTTAGAAGTAVTGGGPGGAGGAGTGSSGTAGHSPASGPGGGGGGGGSGTSNPNAGASGYAGQVILTWSGTTTINGTASPTLEILVSQAQVTQAVTASPGLKLTASATGKVIVPGAASASLKLLDTKAQVTQQAKASPALELTASGTGHAGATASAVLKLTVSKAQVTQKTNAAPILKLSATGTGGHIVYGTASASLSLSASDTPLDIVPGSSNASLYLSATGMGGLVIHGTASAHLKLTSSSIGAVGGVAGAVLSIQSASTPVTLQKTLIVSIASSAGTDQYGNAYVQGLGVYGYGQLVSPEVSIVSSAGGLFVEAS